MPPRVLNDLRQRTGKESISPQDLRHYLPLLTMSGGVIGATEFLGDH